MQLEDAKAVSSPGEDDKPWLAEEEEQKLEAGLGGGYRAMAARANYLAMDRADIQYPTKEACRGMSDPTRGDLRKLKRLVRYVKGRPRVVLRYDYQGKSEEVDGYSDSDWAGCKKTSRSTSGGAIMIGGHNLKTWSSTQKSVTLSSGEAELVAAVKMAGELIGVCQLANDWGISLEAKLMVDSAAAIGVVSRKGNGRLRHVKVGMMWIQERVEDGDITVEKVLGTENPADLMTKYLTGNKIDHYMEKLGQEQREGRADKSLKINE